MKRARSYTGDDIMSLLESFETFAAMLTRAKKTLTSAGWTEQMAEAIVWQQLVQGVQVVA